MLRPMMVSYTTKKWSFDSSL